MTQFLTTQQRNQPRSNSPTDNFSDWVYSLRPKMNEGFVSFDIDNILWNYKKRTFCYIEVKTNNATLSYCQSKQYPILQRILRSGATSEGFLFKGFWVLTFERTCFADGTATIQRAGSNEIHLCTEKQLIDWIKTHF